MFGIRTKLFVIIAVIAAITLMGGALAMISYSNLESKLLVSNQVNMENILHEGRITFVLISVFVFFAPLLFLWIALGRNLGGVFAGMAAEMSALRDSLDNLTSLSVSMKERENRFKAIFEMSPLSLSIILVDDYRLVFMNPRGRDLYQINSNKQLSVSALDFYVKPDDCRLIVDLVRRMGYVGEFEARLLRADGWEFWAMLSAARIEIDGQAAVIISTVDITKRKGQEKALAEAKKLAEQASEAKSLFLATMSHEIRTPMNGVLTMAELLEDMQLTSEQREVTHVIHDSAITLLTIINDILDFSKIESGKMILENVPVPMDQIVESVAELLAPRALEKGIGFFTYIDPNLPAYCLGDSVRLRQIITNLAGNAIKFTSHGFVRIEVMAEDNGNVKFSIVDTGIGLDEQTRARLFEPFSQGDASISRRYGGTGLGLSISRRLVDMMRGDVDVVSQPGEGATFSFTIPMAVADDPASAPPDLGGVNILVLAESTQDSEIIDDYLTHIGAKVVSVSSPEEVLDAVTQARSDRSGFDVVLVDGTTDFRARLALSGALRTSVDTSSACPQVVMMVSHNAQVQVARAACGVDLFSVISRPLRRSALWRVVAAAAGRQADEELEDGSDGSVEFFSPPSVEEAAAANALILVAEDNPTNQLVIRRLMERLGYAIDLAENGMAAWERMQVRDYGLLLTDCHMPEMDGYQLTERVRAWHMDSPNPIPIVALTADALAETVVRCYECGMNAFLSKPIDLAQLDATIRKLLPQAVPLRRRRIQVDESGAVDGGDSPLHIQGEIGLPPVLDLTPLREIFGSISDDARELLTLFVDTTRPLIVEIQGAANSADVVRICEAAHSCKGAGNSAGAYRFARICAEIETACAGGNIDEAILKISTLGDIFEDVVAAVAAV